MTDQEFIRRLKQINRRRDRVQKDRAALVEEYCDKRRREEKTDASNT